MLERERERERKREREEERATERLREREREREVLRRRGWKMEMLELKQLVYFKEF
jgi:hypothetical protein